MASNVPEWLTPVAWVFIGSAILTAVIIAVDVYGRGRRHQTTASEVSGSPRPCTWDPSRSPCTAATAGLVPRPLTMDPQPGVRRPRPW